MPHCICGGRGQLCGVYLGIQLQSLEHQAYTLLLAWGYRDQNAHPLGIWNTRKDQWANSRRLQTTFFEVRVPARCSWAKMRHIWGYWACFCPKACIVHLRQGAWFSYLGVRVPLLWFAKKAMLYWGQSVSHSKPTIPVKPAPTLPLGFAMSFRVRVQV